MAKKPIHTVPMGKGAGSTARRAPRVGRADHKADAEAIGRQSAQRRRVEHISHRADGTIGERRSYGNDPYPPKG
jgi:hypothetical protein